MFKLVRSPSDEITLSNCAAVNVKDHEESLKSSKYAKLNGKYVFKLTPTNDVRQGAIGLGGLQRAWVKADEGHMIPVTPISYDKDISCYLYQMSVELAFYPKDPRKPPPPYDSDQLANLLRDMYNNNPFSREQIFVVKPDKNKAQLLRARILDLTGSNPDMLRKGDSGKGQKRDNGVMTHQTLVKFEKAEDTVLLLTGSSRGYSTQAAIISPDWDFSQMGIGGLDKEFSTIFRRAFASRVFPAEIVEKLGCKHVRGMLLYGPPGCGKTLLARQIGKMLNARELKVINGPEILNKFVGESEANIRKLFTEAEEEQTKLGSASGLHIIIFDEIDAICKERGTVGGGTGVHDTVVNQLLAKLDGVEQLNNVLLIGMTNRRDLIDDALLRPGRMDVQVEIGLPDKDGRFDILTIHTSHMRNNNMLDGAVDLRDLAEKTRNFSGAEIEGLVKSAANTAMNRLIKFKDGVNVDLPSTDKIKVSRDDFQQALLDVKPAFGVSNEQLDKYIRNGIVDWSDQIEQILEKGRLAIKQTQLDKFTSLTSLLLHGRPGCGKTALAAQLAQECKFPFVKIVTPEHMIGYTEAGKCQAIKTVFDDAYKSPLSCVIVDDIDQLLDYVNIGPRFSNVVLQTLKVLLKKHPPHDRKLLIIGTTSTHSVLQQMGLADSFSYQTHVPYLSNGGQVMAVLKELNCFSEADTKAIKKSITPLKDLHIGIKNVISIAGATLQATGSAMDVVFAGMLEEQGCVKFNM
ncbi:vesicle-fusing ATPase-like [Dysidea avara]|uniref:vesicle-fusing ATPase-like n=1 Tax=Dysidea avara TaxID=196820 RepID=UPI00332627C7